MSEWCNKGWVEVVKRLNSDSINGLSMKQIEELTIKDKINNKNNGNNIGIFNIGYNTVKNLWIIYIIGFIVLNLVVKNYETTLIFFIILLINLLILTFNKYVEEKRLDKLEKLNPVSCRVIREGRIHRINPKDLVIGDIVLVDKGDMVPADLRIVDSEGLKVKETPVTGESFIVEKYETKIEERDLALSEMKNILFKSSSIIEGNGSGIVIATGFDTEIGKIIHLLYKNRDKENYFNIYISKLLNKVSTISLVLILLIIVVNIILNKTIHDIINHANLVLVSSGIYIVFPSVYIFQKILGKKLKRNGITFNSLNAFDKINKINTLIMDKIGFISKNKMVATSISTDYELINISDGEKLERVDENIERLLEIALLTCDSKYMSNSDMYNPVHLMEEALKKVSEDNEYDMNTLNRKLKRAVFIPYDSDRRLITSVNRSGKTFRANVKGALDSILIKCTHIMVNGVEEPIKDRDIKKIKSLHLELLEKGLEVLGFAYRNFGYEPTTDENIESNLVYVGLVSFFNPMDEETTSCLEYLRENQINLVLTTEENKISAIASGKMAGLELKEENIMSGVELENIEEAEMEEIIKELRVFSRVNAEHKKRITQLLNKIGNVIAAAGYKFSDLGFLDICDLGIAISNKCSSLVKEMSDIWMEDSSIVNLTSLHNDSKKILKTVEKIITFIIIGSYIQFILQLTCLLIFKEFNMYFISSLWINFALVPLIIIAFSSLYKNVELVNEQGDSRLIFTRQKIDKRFLLKVATITLIALCSIILTHSFLYSFIYESVYIFLGLSLIAYAYISSPKQMCKEKTFNIIIVITLVLLFIAIKIH